MTVDCLNYKTIDVSSYRTIFILIVGRIVLTISFIISSKKQWQTFRLPPTDSTIEDAGQKNEEKRKAKKIKKAQKITGEGAHQDVLPHSASLGGHTKTPQEQARIKCPINNSLTPSPLPLLPWGLFLRP